MEEVETIDRFCLISKSNALVDDELVMFWNKILIRYSML